MKSKPHWALYALVAACALLAGGGAIRAEVAGAAEAVTIAKSHLDDYVSAFNKGDARALAALYAEDAHYTPGDGTEVVGREAVQAGLAKSLAENQGAKAAATLESARLLTPDVLVETAIAVVGEETTRFTATLLKKDGKWLIAQLDETTLPATDAGTQALNELGWLVGSWKDNSDSVKVDTRVDWTKNKHFLRRSFKVLREGQEEIEGTEVIGYDPVAAKIRSWVFDSEGGFGEGFWRQEGNKWLISAKATSPDGATSTAQHIVTRLDDNKFTWESINRQTGGEALPNLDKVEVVRVAE